jgi:hypothetical protein
MTLQDFTVLLTKIFHQSVIQSSSVISHSIAKSVGKKKLPIVLLTEIERQKNKIPA